jgi:hypothetical protein
MGLVYDSMELLRVTTARPKVVGVLHGDLRQKIQTNFNNMSMFSLDNPIMLVRMRKGNMM